jgi:hypothetical protein
LLIGDEIREIFAVPSDVKRQIRQTDAAPERPRRKTHWLQRSNHYPERARRRIPNDCFCSSAVFPFSTTKILIETGSRKSNGESLRVRSATRPVFFFRRGRKAVRKRVLRIKSNCKPKRGLIARNHRPRRQTRIIETENQNHAVAHFPFVERLNGNLSERFVSYFRFLLFRDCRKKCSSEFDDFRSGRNFKIVSSLCGALPVPVCPATTISRIFADRQKRGEIYAGKTSVGRIGKISFDYRLTASFRCFFVRFRFGNCDFFNCRFFSDSFSSTGAFLLVLINRALRRRG